MSIPRILAGFTLFLLALVAALVLYLQYADMSRHRTLIQNQVSGLLDREFKIDGAIEFKLLPGPSLVLEQMSLANADWGSEPQMATVGRASASVQLWSLISGPIIVNSIELRDVEVLLESNAEGATNLEFGAATDEPVEAAPATAEAGEEAISLPLMIDRLELGNIKLVRRQPEVEDRVIRIDELLLEPANEERLRITGGGDIYDEQLELNGEIGPREQIRALGAVDFQLAGKLGSLLFQGDGTVANLEKLQGAKLKLVVSSDDIANVMQLAEVETPLSGPMQLTADVTQIDKGARVSMEGEIDKIGSQGNFELIAETLAIDMTITPLDEVGAVFEVADLPHEALEIKGKLHLGGEFIALQDIVALLGSARVEANGKLATGEGKSQLKVKASGRSLASLLTSLPDIPFDADLALGMTPTLVTVEPILLKFGDSDLQGNVKVNMEEATTVIDADLTSKLLDLRPFEEPAEATEETTDDAAGKEDKAEPKGKYVFVDEPLPFDTLRQTDADVKLAIDKLLSNAAELDHFALQGGLHGGDLKAALDFDTPDGGKSGNTIKLTTSGEQANLDVFIGARDLRLNIASGDIESPDQIPPVGITVQLKSAGDTPRKLAAASNGKVIITQGSGRIENALLNRVSGDILAQLLSALNPMSKTEKFSNWECSIIAIDIVDGLAKIDDLILQGQKIVITASGKVDLNTEKLNIEFNTKARQGVGISADMFVTPFVALQGTLASPGVGLNETGALLTSGAAFATGGLSLIAQGAADRATAEINLCKKTLPKYPHPPLPGLTKGN